MKEALWGLAGVLPTEPGAYDCRAMKRADEPDTWTVVHLSLGEDGANIWSGSFSNLPMGQWEARHCATLYGLQYRPIAQGPS